MAKPKIDIVEIVVDTNEQKPYLFMGYKDVRVHREKLSTGDYSIKGLEHRFTIERKSAEDAYATFSRGRGRFVRELDRMLAMDFAAVILEGSLRTLKYPPPKCEKVTPETVINSLLAWTIDYPIRVIFADDRPNAEMAVRSLCWSYALRAADRPSPIQPDAWC